MESGQSRSTTIFIGNPGAGKSTLLNCMLGKAPGFKSGVSFGGGMTQVLQIYTALDGNCFVDTPGLSDANMREQAAKEIERGLKHGGVFKVFFVIAIESGRIRSEDLTTIKLVLEGAPQIQSNYSIIINKVPKSTHQQLNESEEERVKVTTLLNISCNTGTFAVYFNRKLEELEDEDNCIIPLEPQLLQFINNAPSVIISPDRVERIRASEYDKLNEELAAQLTSLKNDNAKLSSMVANQSIEMKRIEEQHKQEWKELEAQRKRDCEEQETLRKREQKEHEEERKREREVHNAERTRNKKEMKELNDRLQLMEELSIKRSDTDRKTERETAALKQEREQELDGPSRKRHGPGTQEEGESTHISKRLRERSALDLAMEIIK